MKIKAKSMLMLVMALGAIGACANRSQDPKVAGEDSPADTAESQTTPSVSGYSTEANECSDRACSVNQECCPGHTCGLDPQRSRVQRYCMGG